MILILMALGIAAFVFGEGAGAAGTVSTGESLADILSDTFTGGKKSVEAFAQGASLGFIDVFPIGSDFYLREDAAKSWLRLKTRAVTEGITLSVNSAFRFMSDQIRLYQERVAGLLSQQVAPPGYSNHQNGIAIDVSVGSSRDSATYLWLDRNAGEFGWVNTGKNFSSPEYWHWEYNPMYDRWA